MNDSDAYYLVPPPPANKPDPVLTELIPRNDELALPDISVLLASRNENNNKDTEPPTQSATTISDPRMGVKLLADEPDIPLGGLTDIAPEADDIALPPQTIILEKKEMPNIGS